MRTKADELLGYGMSKQQVFDLVVQEFPEVRPGKVADHLRYRPTLWSREHYLGVHRGLLGLIVASALLRVLPPLLQVGVAADGTLAHLLVVPIGSLLLGYGMYRWQGQLFLWVGWGNLLSAFGLIGAFSRFVNDGGDHWALLMKVVAVTIGALSLYLAHKVFAKPDELKDPMGQAPTRYVFPEEGV